MTMQNYMWSSVVKSMLSSAGWYPGRDVGDLVERWRLEIDREAGHSIDLFPLARQLLSEFGGLEVCGWTTLIFDPTIPSCVDLKMKEKALGMRLYPLGEVDPEWWLYISTKGHIVVGGFQLSICGESPTEGIEHLLLGPWKELQWIPIPRSE